MFDDKKDLIAIGAFILLLLVIVLANMSQQKDTDKFITKYMTEEEEKEESESEELQRLMSENLPDVALDAEPLDKTLDEYKTLVYEYEGSLEDVTGGEATGRVKTTLQENQYHLLATFSNLPELQGTDFYEGWIVRNNREQAFRFESTGRLEKIEGEFVNYFGSTKDLTDHRLYVVTLEPDDDDPAPAEHILEGRLEEK